MLIAKACPACCSIESGKGSDKCPINLSIAYTQYHTASIYVLYNGHLTNINSRQTRHCRQLSPISCAASCHFRVRRVQLVRYQVSALRLSALLSNCIVFLCLVASNRRCWICWRIYQDQQVTQLYSCVLVDTWCVYGSTQNQQTRKSGLGHERQIQLGPAKLKHENMKY